MACQLNVMNSGQSTSIYLPVSEADFTVDRNSAQRRQGELTVEIVPSIPPQTVLWSGQQVPYLPLDPTSPLAPFGTEVSVAMTVLAPDIQTGQIGANGWAPLGVYAIATTTTASTGNNLTCTLQLFDRSWPFSQWQLLQNYTVPAAGGVLEDEVVALLSYIWNNNGPGSVGIPVPPWITNPNFQGGSSYVVPAGTYNQGQDPWQACLDMAQSGGQQLFFDVNGVLTGKPIPGSAAGGSLSSLAPVWNFYPGEVTAQGTYVHPIGGTPFTTPAAVTLAMTRDGVKNDIFVAATGAQNLTGTNTPIQAEAADNNSASPTFVGGGIGRAPNFIMDSLITSSAQALSEAQFNLGVSLSSAYTLSVSAPNNPLFDIDDVFTATEPRLGLNMQKTITDTIHYSVEYATQTVLSGRVIAPGA